MRKDTIAAWGAFALFLAAFLLSGESKADGVENFCRSVVGLDEHMERYRQRMVFGYAQPDAGVVKLMYANTQTGDWTLIMVDVTGLACTAAQGIDLVRRGAATDLPLFSEDIERES